MKIFLKKVSVASVVLAGLVGWSGAQAADVSNGGVAFTRVGANVGGGDSFFDARAASGGSFTDTFTFDLTSPTGLTTFSKFKVTSVQPNPSLNPATVGLDLTGFWLTGPGGLSYSATLATDSGVYDEWRLPTEVLGNGHYTISVTGTVHSAASLAITGKLVTAVPEPETYAMLLGGLGMLGLMARRKRQASKNV
jgi:hypothetical protein